MGDVDYVEFGRTGLRVSAVGLGTGGTSKLGLGTGGEEADAVAVVRRAHELGVTYFDTAKGYGTEALLGRALRGIRDEVIVSSKAYASGHDGTPLPPDAFRREVEDSLLNLQTETIDVYHFHRLTPDEYDYATAELLPVLDALRDEGKVRFVGASESTSTDGDHRALERVVSEGRFDVLMTGFNLFNQGSRARVLPAAAKNDIAVEIMGSARGPYARPDRLVAEIERLVGRGLLPESELEPGALDALLRAAGARSLAELSYRLARYEPGVHVVLVGTGNVEHLEENLVSLHGGPLADPGLSSIIERFGHLRVTRG